MASPTPAMREFDPVNTSLEGVNLIQAGAGTGKTYTIAAIVLRLVLEHALPIRNILVVTFTEAATEELRGRIRARLQEAYEAIKSGQANKDGDSVLQGIATKQKDVAKALLLLQNALRGFDEAPVFTIHGFCRRMLQDNAFESGALFDTELVTNQEKLLRQICEDFWRKKLYRADPPFVSYLLEKHYSPDAFMDLLGRHSGNPFLKIIPKKAPGNKLVQKTYRHYLEHFQAARATWQEEAKNLRELLLISPALNRQSYPYKSLPVLLDNLDAFFVQEEPPFRLPDKFEKFTAGFLRAKVKKGYDAPEHRFFEQCEEMQYSAQSLFEQCEQGLLQLKLELFSYAKSEMSKRKDKQNIQFFDDLLLKLYHALDGQGGERLAKAICRQYPAMLIDEFQDTDHIQYKIFQHIVTAAEKPVLFLIGDPKQAIYSFRGADIFTYMQAVQDAGHNYTLSQNWRSSKALIEGVNAIFGKRPQPFIYPQIEFHPAQAGKDPRPPQGLEGPGLHLWFIQREPDQTGKPAAKINKAWANGYLPRLVAGEIARLLNQKTVRAGDIAVLVRKNKQAGQMQEALREYRIPAVLYSRESLFDSAEAGDMERLLAALLELNRPELLRAVLCGPLFGLDGNQLYTLEQDGQQWDAWLEEFRYYAWLWQKRGFIQMFRHLMTRKNVAQRLLVFTDGERRLTNILHLAEALQQAASAPRRGMLQLYRWLCEQRLQRGEAADEYQLRLESDEHAVKLVTIHKSKGLEYPVTFVPFAWDGRSQTNPNQFTFHDPRSREMFFDLGSEEQEKHYNQALEEEQAENLRLLYVALTRSIYRCYLVWGCFSDAGKSPLAYLLHPGRDLNKTDDNTLLRDLAELPHILTDDKPRYYNKLYSASHNNEFILAARRFKGKIKTPWEVSSFTSLSRTYTIPDFNNTLNEQPERDNVSDMPPAETPLEPYSNLFDFPAGARAGEFFHYFFETADFCRRDDVWREQRISHLLRLYGYSAEWLPLLSTRLEEILQTPLDAEQPELKLACLATHDRLNELEFYFPLEQVEVAGLRRIMDKAGIETPPFGALRGYMKGYIDMVFQWQERFYVLDYKSNRLGRSLEDYQASKLDEAMRHHHYDFQYILYSLALHRYLGLRMEEYDYAKHFGGVYYTFLRGMSPQAGSGYGVFKARPAQAVIETLSAYCGSIGT